MKNITVNKATGIITAIRSGNGHFEPDENHAIFFLDPSLDNKVKIGDKFPFETNAELLGTKKGAN